MSLSEKIEIARKRAEALANCTLEKHKDFVLKHSFEMDLKQIINNDLMYNNPEALFEEYKEYFKTKALPTKIINSDIVFYRGRIGNEVLCGADGDYNKNFVLPYYMDGIKAPPPIHANGGRFNRQGISYLYLADTIETCLAEVHLQIGQNCSVGMFKSKEQLEVIDLTKFQDDVEMTVWLKVLTQPVYSGNEYVYNMTRFLSDVFKSINRKGIFFESVQSEGHNLVCFEPDIFELIQYSEKIYAASKIKYEYYEVEDSIREYVNSPRKNSINAYNEYEWDNVENKFKYLNEWIENEERIHNDKC